MKLFSSPFERIKTGVKTIEIRLNDEKRQGLKVGDEIEFAKLPELTDKIRVKVLKLEKFDSFAELMNAYPASKFGLKHKEDMLNGLREIYSAEEEKKYGVLAIHITLV